jgi:uncharacterized glyoxalase superfamily protein PhnB
MIANRSVPTSVVLPHLTYRDVPAAIDWLARAFGFREHYRYGEPVSGAQMCLGDAWIMLASTSMLKASPAEAGFTTQSVTIFLDDVEGHYARAKAAGAKVVEQPHETAYGEFQYGAEDLDGHLWLFSRHARDVAPEAWGAVVRQPPGDERK